jgi:hypothetical protein
MDDQVEFFLYFEEMVIECSWDMIGLLIGDVASLRSFAALHQPRRMHVRHRGQILV